MGSNSSTRRVTVINDNSGGVIRISESVVKKLKGEETQQNQSSSLSSSSPQTLPQPVTVPQQSLLTKTQSSNDDYHNYLLNMSDTLALRQKYDDEIRVLQQTWKSQIEKLQIQNDNLHKVSKDKFASDLTGIEKKYMKTRCEPICRDIETKVIDCYQQNKSQPLKCSSVVREFTDCVRSVRRNIFNGQV